jgi:hypothetical protein
VRFGEDVVGSAGCLRHRLFACTLSRRVTGRKGLYSE